MGGLEIQVTEARMDGTNLLRIEERALSMDFAEAPYNSRGAQFMLYSV